MRPLRRVSARFAYRQPQRSLAIVAEPSKCSESTPAERTVDVLKEPASDSWSSKKMALAGAGGSSILGGGLLWGWQHAEWLLPYAPDAGAGVLIIAGAAALQQSMASADKKPAVPKVPTPKNGLGASLEFVPLPLEPTVALPPVELGAAETLLAAADKKRDEREAKSREERRTALVDEMKTELEADDADARRARQRLTPRLFVVDFDTRPVARTPPPTMRKMLDTLTTQVNVLLGVATPFDEVVVRICSPGGGVSDYGLAAAQLMRLRAAGVSLTACVDVVAASGGYMMAAVASRVVAAPFSIVGSVGVIAGAPNISRLLERNDVEFVQRTAGQYKRTINVLTPNTEEGLAKFEEELEAVHTAFIDHVQTHRPELDVDVACTGESWIAMQAPAGMVDDLATSDAYLRGRATEAEVLVLRERTKPRGFLADFVSQTQATLSAFGERALGALGASGGGLRAGGGGLLASDAREH